MTNKLKLLLLALTALLLPLQSVLATQQISVSVNSVEQFKRLQVNGYDVVNFNDDGKLVVLIHDDAELSRLDWYGYDYEVTHKDLGAFYRSRFGARRDVEDMGPYRSYGEMMDELADLYDSYSDIMSEPFSIGESMEGEDIIAFRITDNPEQFEEDEPQVLFTSLIHSREYITGEMTFGLAYKLLEEYGEDDRITDLIDNRDIWIIPCVNPDGYKYNERDLEDGGDGMWRKNRRHFELDGRDYIGVDLNRNFGYKWGYDDLGSSGRGYSSTYRGASAFSEPETRAIRDLVNDQNFKTSVFFHSWGNICLHPWGYDFLFPEDRDMFHALGHKMSESSGYLVGAGWELIYRTNGDSDDWLYASDDHNTVYPFTIEIGDDSNDEGFMPAEQRIEELVTENLESCLTLIEYTDNPFRSLEPPAPDLQAVIAFNEDQVALNWQPEFDSNNPIDEYYIVSVIEDEPIVFDAERDNEEDYWQFDKSNILDFDSAEDGENCYRISTTTEMATLTLRHPFMAPETIRCEVKMALEGWRNHYLAVEISTDGHVWIPLEGSDTEHMIVGAGDFDLGPGMTGRTEVNGRLEWQDCWWITGDMTDKTVKFRFRFYGITNLQNDILRVDNIRGIPIYSDPTIIADGIPTDRNVSVVTLDEFDEDLIFAIHSIDEDGDASLASNMMRATILPSDMSIDLNSGWSLIGAPLISENMEMTEILADLLDAGNIDILKNVDGDFFLPDADHPDSSFNSIGDWDPFAGYWIRMTNDDVLNVSGKYMAIDTPYPLDQHWNMISYTPWGTLSAPEAFASVELNIILAKDGHGNFWVPQWDFNNIYELKSGDGVLLKMLEADTLTYPFAFDLNAGEPSDLRPKIAALEFSPPSNNNHSVLLKLSPAFPTGQIVIYDDNGYIAGMSSVSGQSQLGIAAWAEKSPGSAGLYEGETFRAIYRLGEGAIETPIDLQFLAGDLNYITDGFTVFEASIEANTLPEKFGLITAYPNPFNSSIRLGFSLPAETYASLKVYDVQGRLVYDALSSRLKAGSHDFTWHALNYPTGVYIARLAIQTETGEETTQKKLLLVR